MGLVAGSAMDVGMGSVTGSVMDSALRMARDQYQKDQ